MKRASVLVPCIDYTRCRRHAVCVDATQELRRERASRASVEDQGPFGGVRRGFA